MSVETGCEQMKIYLTLGWGGEGVGEDPKMAQIGIISKFGVDFCNNEQYNKKWPTNSESVTQNDQRLIS